ncbi:MAG: periplasmic heavy metal sensor [Terriglobia bacterium]
MKTTIASLALAILFCGQSTGPARLLMGRVADHIRLAFMCYGPAMGQEVPAPNEEAAGHPPARAVPRPDGDPSSMGLRGPRKWWKDSELMHNTGVSDDQVQKIEEIFQDHQIQTIDLHAALEKQEAILPSLLEEDQAEESQVMAQIDKVAQARANLEKSNARTLLAIRRVLSGEQWKKLRNLPGITPFLAGPGFAPPVGPPSGN